MDKILKNKDKVGRGKPVPQIKTKYKICSNKTVWYYDRQIDT